MDFTKTIYKELLKSLMCKGYRFIPFHEYIHNTDEKAICLRHDVDLKPYNSLDFAKIQSSLGIQGTYFFRIVPASYNPDIIRQIAALGHEIGYHYEELSITKGNTDSAYELFCKNLEKIRQLYPVKTICMHGSPLSPHDSKKIWAKYNYRDLGIIGEPYFDINFNEVFYLTDTGRRWNGDKFSIRDRVDCEKGCFPVFSKTKEIIQAANDGKLPSRIMFTFHPQRWTDNPVAWMKELVFQNAKNIIKALMPKTGKSS